MRPGCAIFSTLYSGTQKSAHDCLFESANFWHSWQMNSCLAKAENVILLCRICVPLLLCVGHLQLFFIDSYSSLPYILMSPGQLQVTPSTSRHACQAINVVLWPMVHTVPSWFTRFPWLPKSYMAGPLGSPPNPRRPTV